MAFNKDEMEAPAWLDKSFFEKVLKQSENDDGLVVDEYRIIPGTKPGDHFASIIFRVFIHYRSHKNEKEISLIVKTIPEGEGLKQELLKNGVMFETEIKMYNIVMPEMHRVLKATGDDTELGTSLLYYSSEPTWVVVFEDLTKRGYGMKPNQLDLEQAKIVYTKLAKWHATSMFLAETNPVIKSFNSGLGAIMNEEFAKIWVDNMSILADMCSEWPGFENYSERLRNIQDPVIKRLKEIYCDTEATEYNVLNHGDSNFKNYMYKFVDGKAENILLIDYQICVWGSPAIDILYTMYMAVNTETRDNHREEIIKLYHDEFSNTLKNLGYHKRFPTLIDLHVELTKCGHMETFLITTFLPLMMLSSEEMVSYLAEKSEECAPVDFADQEQLGSIVINCFHHPKYETVIKKYLPMLLRKGFLDI